MWSLCGLDQKSMRQVVLKSEKLLCCLKKCIFPFFKNVHVSLPCFPVFLFWGYKKNWLEISSQYKDILSHKENIYLDFFHLVYICLLGQYGWALTSTTSQYGFMLATHYNMLWINYWSRFVCLFVFPAMQIWSEVWVNQNNEVRDWNHFKTRWKYVMSETTSNHFTTCQHFCR